MEKVEKAILCSGYQITIFGIFGNSLSLCYFLSQTTSNSQLRNTETSTTNLFVMLNCFDLLVCMSGFVLLFDSGHEGTSHYDYINPIFMASVEMTYFITCLLSIRRLVNLMWPLYLVIRKTLNIAIAIFSCMMVAIEIILSSLSNSEVTEYVEKVRCVVLFSLIVIIISSSVISFMKLNQSYTQDQHRRTRYATVTVGILSTVFCVCNIVPLILSGLLAFRPKGVKSIPSIVNITVKLVQSVLLPLNSACNPVVYITRRSDMRTFLTTKCRGVIRYCKCGSGDTGGRSGEET